jgi:hypothetical protein
MANARGVAFIRSSDGTLVAEASDLGLRNVPNVLHVEGLEGVPGVRSFGLVGTDESGGDVAGWRYLEQGKSVRMLVIND